MQVVQHLRWWNDLSLSTNRCFNTKFTRLAFLAAKKDGNDLKEYQSKDKRVTATQKISYNQLADISSSSIENKREIPPGSFQFRPCHRCQIGMKPPEKVVNRPTTCSKRYSNQFHSIAHYMQTIAILLKTSRFCNRDRNLKNSQFSTTQQPVDPQRSLKYHAGLKRESRLWFGYRTPSWRLLRGMLIHYSKSYARKRVHRSCPERQFTGFRF